MSFRNQLSESAGLLSAVDAVRNIKAAVVLLVSLVLAGLIFALAGIVSVKVHPALGAVFFLLGIAAAFYGSNATGIMMMDEAHGNASRPMISAILTSLATGHRLLGVMFLIGLAYILGLLVMALVLFICKIPGVGPLLFTFVFPLCVVISGIAVFAFYAVVLPLVAPATWSGATVMNSLSRLAAIARRRTIGVVLSMMVLLLLVGIVFGIVLGITGIGTLIAGGMSAGIVGFGSFGIGSLMGGMSGMDSGGGHAAAGAIGGGLVWAVALVLPSLVYLRGCCQVYLANIQGVDVEAIEQKMRDLGEAARRKTEELREKGTHTNATETPVISDPSASIAASTTALTCPSCGTDYSEGDAFCGSCGHKLG